MNVGPMPGFWTPLTLCLVLIIPGLGQSKALNLNGYMDNTGAITVQHGGDTVDPYFALQALLLAKAHGLDIAHLAPLWTD